MSTLRVQDKVCIVTAGAQGIGEAIGRGLAKEGAKVVFADINVELAEKVAGDVNKQGGKAIAIRVDVGDREQVRNVVQKTVAELVKST